MPNYTTLLKTWGDTGAEYPTGYSYVEGEQPVDAWDNFLIHNVVKDLQNLIDTTNDDLLLRSGGSLLSDLSVGQFGLVGDSGSIDFGGTEITADGTFDVLQSLSVGGNIGVAGTVDGVDVGLLKTDHDTLSSSHDTLEGNYDTHAVDSSFHHTRYADSEARAAVNGSSVSITGDAGTLDGLDSGDFARQNIGVEHDIYQTKADVPASIGVGETVFINEDKTLYVEDGT